MRRRTFLVGTATALVPVAGVKAEMALGGGQGLDERRGGSAGGGGGGGTSGTRVTMGTAVYSTGTRQFVLASKTAVVNG